MQAVFAVTYCALPATFSGIFTEDPSRLVRNWHVFFCVATGLWGGLIIGLFTEYFTSNRYQPVQVRLSAKSDGPICCCMSPPPGFNMPTSLKLVGRSSLPSHNPHFAQVAIYSLMAD